MNKLSVCMTLWVTARISSRSGLGRVIHKDNSYKGVSNSIGRILLERFSLIDICDPLFVVLDVYLNDYLSNSTVSGDGFSEELTTTAYIEK